MSSCITSSVQQPTKDPNEVQKRGSVLALISITRRPGSNLPQWVPDLWKVMYNSLETFAPSGGCFSYDDDDDDDGGGGGDDDDDLIAKVSK